MASDDEQRLIVNGRNEGGLALSPLRKQKSEVDNELRARWRKQSEMFMEWVQSGENLDIYQAFRLVSNKRLETSRNHQVNHQNVCVRRAAERRHVVLAVLLRVHDGRR